MNILVKTTGFIGDILIASSVAESISNETGGVVDFLIGFPQPYELLKLNPFIRNVYLSDDLGPYPKNESVDKNYDLIYTLPHTTPTETPIIQFQKTCNVKNPRFNYKIYTNPIIDDVISLQLKKLRTTTNKRVVGFTANWKQSTATYTKEQFKSGIQHTHTNTRNIDWILSELSKKFILIPLGFDPSVSQYDLGLESCSLYSYTASTIKNCDVIIGSEGGLTNLAAGVGTKCIITTDFINYLYGEFGRMNPCKDFKFGAANLCPDKGHIHTDPYISDEELLKLIVDNV